jgi:hypothetical protein
VHLDWLPLRERATNIVALQFQKLCLVRFTTLRLRSLFRSLLLLV